MDCMCPAVLCGAEDTRSAWQSIKVGEFSANQRAPSPRSLRVVILRCEPDGALAPSASASLEGRLTNVQAAILRGARERAPQDDANACGKRPASVLRLVDQLALLDPRHHVAEFDADLLDRMGGELGAGCLTRVLVDLILQHPLAPHL